MAKAKVTMLLDLSEKLFNGKLQKLQGKFEKFEKKVGKGVDKLRNKFGRWADEIPGLGKAFDLIKNPIALAIAGILTFGTIAAKGVDAAKKFDSAFLPIRNLNLDKSKAELDSYRSKIRDATFEIGTNLADSTNAMYDLQSATGLYGNDAIDVFKKVGKYSLATGANINDAMNSTTKAMKAFGLETSQIDQLLESNAKTVQVGITTFDELAKVQTEYAGAASSAGQGIDQANKVFAMFTSVAKNSDIGANMTKTFFQGLGQQADKFEGVLGVKVFDEKGMMRNADVLLKEISGKFQNMNDQQITEAINKIGGPEGLRGALNKVKTGAVDMIQTFDAFDSSKFSLQKALENAQGDFTTIKKMFGNRLEAIFSKIGEKILPILANIFSKLSIVLNFIYKNFDTIETVFEALIIGVGTYTGLLGVLKIQTLLAAASSGTLTGALALVKLGIHAIGTAIYSIPIVGWIALAVSAFVILYQKVDKFRAFIKGLVGVVKSVLGNIAQGFKGLATIIHGALTLDLDKMKKGGLQLGEVLDPTTQAVKFGSAFTNAYNAEIDKSVKNEKDTEKKKNSLYNNNLLGAGNGTANPTSSNKLQNDITKVTGAAKQTRNISIKIDALHKGNNVIKKEGASGMTEQDFENWFNDMLIRVIRNAELS